jgi:hypothetical protein
MYISRSQYLNAGRGRPRNSQPGTAALRNAGVLACEFWHRPGALARLNMCRVFTVFGNSFEQKRRERIEAKRQHDSA